MLCLLSSLWFFFHIQNLSRYYHWRQLLLWGYVINYLKSGSHWWWPFLFFDLLYFPNTSFQCQIYIRWVVWGFRFNYFLRTAVLFDLAINHRFSSHLLNFTVCIVESKQWNYLVNHLVKWYWYYTILLLVKIKLDLTTVRRKLWWIGTARILHQIGRCGSAFAIFNFIWVFNIALAIRVLYIIFVFVKAERLSLCIEDVFTDAIILIARLDRWWYRSLLSKSDLHFDLLIVTIIVILSPYVHQIRQELVYLCTFIVFNQSLYSQLPQLMTGLLLRWILLEQS